MLAGRTTGSESTASCNNLSNSGIISIIFFGIILFDIEIAPLLLTKSVMFTVSLIGCSIIILDNFSNYLPLFKKVMPVEYKKVLMQNFEKKQEEERA